MNWKIMESGDQLDNLIETSYQKPQVIYKHSIRCGISSVTKSRLERDWDIDDNELDIYFLDLIKHKQLSNLIEETFGVYHESPQILLIINGKAVYHTSHMNISTVHLKKALTLAA
jgi:bacillithiol system protein YtxJ